MSIRKTRVLWVLLLAALLVFACGTALGLTYPFLSTTTDSVRMRRSASDSATVLETIPAATQVEVQGKTGNYYQVVYNNRKGYVQTKYISTEADQMVQITAAPREVVGEYPYTTVTLAKVNLRASRSVRAELLKKIPQGAEISVLANGSTWAEVEYAGIRGYVKNEYITLKDVKKIKVTPTPSPVPTLSPEESEAEYAVLEKGSEGAEVKALQNALIQLGFLKGSADGKFGAATENAVLLFQQQNGYPTTGIMDANTQAFLYSGKPKNAFGKKEAVTQVSPVTGATMKQHDTGDEVAELQKRLQALGYYSGGEVSGIFNLDTKKAVIAFQKKNGLTADGVADADTQRKLWSMDALGKADTPTPKPTATPSPEPTYTIPDTTVRKNDSGSDAKAVQKRLKELGYYKGTVDGKFTAASVKALQEFQQDHGLEPDGVAGKGTYAVLFSSQALKKGTTPTPTPELTPAPGDEESGIPAEASYETLRKGNSSSDVAYLQQVLITLGYLSGEPDGNYGTETEKAVKAFQKNNNLGADGTAGVKTLTLLYSSEASPAPTVDPKKVSATATVTATPEPTTNLKKGTSGSAVKAMQEQLIKLGYLKGKADGKFGTSTYQALVAFQRANKLTADGVAGNQTLARLKSSSAVSASDGKDSTASSTAAPEKVSPVLTGAPTASRVQYANWYTTVKTVCKSYPYATVYDYETGISWQVHIFSVGAHADYEPLTANDTSKMLKVMGGNTWNPRAVWVVFANGSVYMASTHSMPHGVIHITDNNFAGHTCLHFPRTQAQVESIGVYATSHQNTIDAGWARTQAMK